MNPIVFIGRTAIESNPSASIRRVGGSLFYTLLHLQTLTTPDNMQFITNTSSQIEADFQRLKCKVHRIQFPMTPTETYENGYLVACDDYMLDQQWTLSHLKPFEDTINNASIIVMDMYRADFIVYVSRINPRARIFLTGTSASLIRSIRPFAPKIAVLKIDMKQARALTNITIHDLVDCGLVQRQLKDIGFHQAIITLNRLGCYYFSDDDNGHYHSKIVSRNAFIHAGDAYFAGMIYAALHGSPLSIMALEGIHQSGHFIRQLMEDAEARKELLPHD